MFSALKEFARTSLSLDFVPSMNPEPVKDRTVYVTHIECAATEGELMQIFSACGKVLKVRLCGNPSQSTQFGFVEFEKSTEAQNLVQCEGKRIGKFCLHCSLSRNVIHDHDPSDADTKVGKDCTFGFNLGKVSATPLCDSGVQQKRAFQQFSAEELLEAPANAILPYLCSLSGEPLEVLQPLLHLGVERPSEASAVIQLWCKKGGLLTAWVTHGYRLALQETNEPVKLMMFGKRLVEAKILGQ